MRDRILRLTAPLLIIITLLLGVCPHHAAGQAQTATTYHTYIPLVIGSGDTPAPAPSTDTFSEVSAARTAYSDLAIANINGRMVARIRRYAEPNGYYDTASASWQAIEPQLIADGDSYRNTAAGFTARFRSGGTQQILQLGRPGEAILTLSLPAGIAPAPVADTTTITYPNALGTASLVYHSQPWGVKEELVIDAPGGPSSYSLHLDAPGLVPQRQDDGDYLLSDSAGNAIWRIPAPVGADASGAEAALDLSISNSDSGLLVQLSIDPPWLSDPARSYPIRLDPSLVDPQYIGGESYVQSAAPTIVSYNQRNRFIGYSALKGITRLYTPIDLSILPESIAPDQILAARLVLTQYVADSATAGFASSVYTVPSAWSDLTLNWNNQPATGSRVSGAQISRDLEQKRWDITDWVRTVVTDQTSNHGLTIRADQEMLGGGIFWSSFCYPAFCSAPSDRPFLEFEIALDSGLDPLRDTWAWPNREGQPSFAQYADDYGIAETTHVVTETRVLQTLSYTDVLHLPIRFAPLGIDASIPLSITEGLTSTTTSDPSPVLIPRPLSYLYEEVVVKAIYDDAFSADYTAAMQGGLCMGMAATVADFYANGGPTPDELGGGETVRSIPDQAAAQDFIQTYHGRQIGSQVLNWLADQGRMDVRAYYERLVARIGQAAWRSDPEIIGILKGASCEDMEIGHALLPYKVVPTADARVRVYVYDPNDPPTAADDVANRYIELDLASGTWSYELAPATASRPAVIWVGRDLFSLPLHLLREKPTQPTTSNSDLITVQGGTSHAFGGTSHAFGGTSHAFGGTSHAFGTDTEANTHTGCVNLPDHAVSFVQEIAHSFRVTPLTGNRVFPDALFFPAGRTLAVTSVGTGGDTLTFGPHGAVGYLTTSNDDTHDVLTTNAAFLRATLQTSDPSKPASLYQIHETDGWTRIYALNNTTIDPDAPLISEVSADLTSLTVINPGAARSYDLGLGHYGSDGVGQVIFPGLPIGAHERRIYTPLTWVDLPHSALLVQVDSDNDGTIDRTDMIGGNVFPAVASLADTPDTPGAELTLIDRQLSRSYYGWADIFHPLTTTLQIDSRNTGLGWLDHDRHNPLRGKLADLLRQIIGGGNPGLAVGDWLIGVPGQNTSLLSEIERQARSRTVAFQPGSLVLVPLYDQTQVVHGRLVAYRIGGFALVEVLSYPHSESSDSRHQSYHDRAIHVRLITRIVP